MKSPVLFFASAFALSSAAQAQSLADFLRRVPALPDKPCTASLAQQDEFKAKIDALLEEVHARLQQIDDETEQWAEANQAQITRAAMARAGMGGVDLAQLEKMDKKQQQAAIDKMVQQATGMSMEDLKQLSEIKTEAGKEARARAMLEDMQNDPRAMQKISQMDQRGPHAQVLKMIESQQALLGKVTAAEAKARDQLKRIDEDPEMAKLQDLVSQLQTEWTSTMGIGSAEGDQRSAIAFRRMVDAEQQYCFPQSRKYSQIMQEYLDSLSTATFNELDRLQGEIEKTQTGLGERISPPGKFGLEALKDFLGLLAGAYKYDLRPDNRK